MKQIILSEYSKAVIYCRVSSDRQVNEGGGLDSQEQRCIKYAQEKGLEVVEVFRDEGISGGLLERPAMKNLIAYLDRHNTEKFVVIFDDLKRFARDLKVHLMLRTELGLRNAKVECLNFKFEESPEGIFVENIIAATGQLEREQNRRQVLQKQKSRLESGYWAFHAPLGFNMSKERTRGKILVPDPIVAPILKEAFEKFKNFELNTIQAVKDFIVYQFTLKGIEQKLRVEGVKALLSNPLYAGYLAYEPWDISFREANHTGIISIETYYAIQEKLLNRARPRLRKDYSEDFPLRNYVSCVECKKPMTASYHRGKSGTRYPHYWCKTDNCLLKNKTLLKKSVEDDFEDLLKRLTPKPEVIKLAEAVLNDVWQNRQKYEAENRIAITRELQGIGTKIESCLTRITENSNPTLAKYYKIELEKLDNKKTALEAELGKQRYLEHDFGEASRVVFSYLSKPLKNWNSPDYTDKRTLLHMYFERGVPYERKNGFGTPQLPLLIGLITQKHTSKKSLVEMARVKLASKTHSLTDWSQD